MIRSENGGAIFCDALFLALIAIFAWLCVYGDMAISGNGAIMDSDLQTYAQGMAGEANPDLFKNDPALSSPTPANSIPNLERLLAGMLAPPGQWAAGLLRAGGAAIFLFFAGWYALGRWLYGAPVLAALLATVSGITIWAGWGTFWGVLHSDPIPRVFYAAFFPFLLLLALPAVKRPWLRPLAMFAAGASIWIHGVSALNCGAMFFMAFLCLWPKGAKGRIANLCLCLAAFFGPVLVFLWPSLIQGGNFSQEQLAMFQELFNLRWHKDYVGFAGRVAHFFLPGSASFPVIVGGLLCWLITLRKGSQREAILCRAAPAFLFGILLVAVFCWAESRYAPELGRLPMGHELVRGLRFFIPISWLLICAAVGLTFGKTVRRLILCAIIAALICVCGDRQMIAAQYAFSQITGMPLPQSARGDALAIEARAASQAFAAIKNIVPAGESVYSPCDAMQIRYLSLRPLAHSFKDGYIHFYNKNPQGSAKWLEMEKLARLSKDGWIAAWRESGAPWLLLPPGTDGRDAVSLGSIALEKDGWLLIQKN